MRKKHSLVVSLIIGILLCHFPENALAGTSEAADYLESQQNNNGSWGTDPSAIFFETTEAIKTLRMLGRMGDSYNRGIGFVKNAWIGGVEDYSHRINAIFPAGEDVTDDLDHILNAQNSDGGWGYDTDYQSDVYHTAVALSALNTVGGISSSIVSGAISYILSKQNANGSFSLNEDDESVYITSIVMLALYPFESGYGLSTQLENAKGWLLTQQNPDGGFGEDGVSSIFESSFAYMAIFYVDPTESGLAGALIYLNGNQGPDGSFNGDIYLTTAGARALQVSSGDRDGDGISDTLDNCPDDVNPGQENNDGDSEGDICDPDDDNDGVLDAGGSSIPSTEYYPVTDVVDVTGTVAVQPPNSYIYLGTFNGEALGWYGLSGQVFYEGDIAATPSPLLIYIDANGCGCIEINEGDTLTVLTNVGEITIYLPELSLGWQGFLFVADDGSTYYDDALTQLAMAPPASDPDNCHFIPNPDQSDVDLDAWGDACDNCWAVSNSDQIDTNANCPSMPYSTDPMCGDACEVATQFRITDISQDWGFTDDVTITWESTPGNTYDIYSKDDFLGAFTPVDSVVAGDVTTSWIDDGTWPGGTHPTTVDQRYYKVSESGVDSENTVGMFKIVAYEGMNLISLPLIPFSNALEDVIGTQLTGATNEGDADRVWIWNGTNFEFAWLVEGAGPPYDGKYYTGNVETTITLDADQGAWLQVRTGHGDQDVYLLGEVSTVQREIPLSVGMNLVGSCYPVSVPLGDQNPDDANLWESGATGANNEGDADRVWSWTGTNYQLHWLVDGVGATYDGLWYSGNQPSVLVLEPGKGYWIQIREGHAAFPWIYPLPY